MARRGCRTDGGDRIFPGLMMDGTGTALSMNQYVIAAASPRAGAARLAAALLGGSMLAGMPVAAMAQDAAQAGAATQAQADAASPAPAAQGEVVRTISVEGAQRIGEFFLNRQFGYFRKHLLATDSEV